MRSPDPIREAVVDRQPISERERLAMMSFLEHYDSLEQPLDQEVDPVHVTGSAIVAADERVLLLKHKRLGIWLQPGGHIDPGETPQQAALREAVEETGLDLRLVSDQLFHVDVHDGGRGHTHLDLRYLVTLTEGADDRPRPPAGESQHVEWMSAAEAVERADDEALRDLLRMMKRSGVATVLRDISENGTRR